MYKRFSALLALVAAVLVSTTAVAKQAHVIFVFDNSGSMEGHKLREAKDALSRSVELLPPSAIVGILIFSSTYRWIYQSATRNLDTIRQRISQIQVEGGTALGNALLAAADELGRLRREYRGDPSTAIFQVVAITDGQNTEGRSPRDAVPRFQHERFKLDVIGVEFHDRDLPGVLAHHGFHNGYHTTDRVEELFEVLKEVLKIEEVAVVDGVSDFDLIKDIPTDVARAMLMALVTASKAAPSANTAPPGPPGRAAAPPGNNPGRTNQSRNRSGCEASPNQSADMATVTFFVVTVLFFILLRRR
jgi:uncharacterized protein YegL